MSALQSNPSIMTRNHHGFVTTTKLPSGGDLSLRRHQVNPQVFVHPTEANSGMDKRALNLSPYATQYARTHVLRYSPNYASMHNAQKDQPSGAAHNNVATCVWPKDNGALSSPSRRGQSSAIIQTEADATGPNADGRVGLIEDPRGDDVDGYPHVSDYKATFRAPEMRTLAGPGTEGAGIVPMYRRDFSVPTHAIPPPFCSDNATQEPHQRISGGSGYALNNAFAFDNTSMSRRAREPAQSHYKTTFVEGPVAMVPTLGDGSVAPPDSRASNGCLRNGDQLPQVHAANEGGQPWEARDFDTTYKSTYRDSEEAPAAAAVPDRPIQRPQSVALNARPAARRRIEHTAFSRSILPPPTDGLGSEHMKLRLGSGPEAGAHHRSTRPHTAGYSAAPSHYHNAHTHRVAPIAPRVGSGLEESQELAHLRHLRKSSPLEYEHELAGAPRYLSSYHLLHGDKRAEAEEKEAAAMTAPYTMGARGLNAGWGVRTADTEASVSNGGVRNVWQTSYDRATADARAAAHAVQAQGKAVAEPQGTGYTANTRATELEHASWSTRTPAGAAAAVAARFSLTSHLSHQHPAAHAAALPPAQGYQINMAAPSQSSYSREHMPDSANVFPPPNYHPVATIDGRTLTLQARKSDLHPTVVRALDVNEPPPSKNYGNTQSPLVPLRAEF